MLLSFQPGSRCVATRPYGWDMHGTIGESPDVGRDAVISSLSQAAQAPAARAGRQPQAKRHQNARPAECMLPLRTGGTGASC